jgi:hypothetical protein
MKVRNLTPKPIGFNSVILLPDQTAELPKGFGSEHPTTKYYLSRKWLEAVGDADSNAAPVNSVNVQIKTGGGAAGNDNGKNPDETPNDGAVDSANGQDLDTALGSTSDKVKTLDRLTKEELQALASERGVEFSETDTRQVLINKLKAAQNSGE